MGHGGIHWTEELVCALRDLAASGLHCRPLSAEMSARFGKTITRNMIRGACNRRGIPITPSMSQPEALRRDQLALRQADRAARAAIESALAASVIRPGARSTLEQLGVLAEPPAWLPGLSHLRSGT
jgi:hypothetical protein